MKQKLVLGSVLLLIVFADIAVAKTSPDKNEPALFSGSSRVESKVTLTSLDRLPYQNLRDSSKWSKLTNGRALAVTLRKRHAHAPQDPDFCFDCDLLFSDKSGDQMSQVTLGVATSAGGCDWKCCFKSCMDSAMAGAGTLCTSNCIACGATGGAWPCAVCASCGTVGFVAIEFCGLHCCVNPGCPAG